MKHMENEKLKNIKGGGINWGLVAGFSSVISFIAGFVEGLINPKKCNS